MSFLSQPGQIGFKTQASAGTYMDPGAVAPNKGVFIRMLSGGMAAVRELITPDPEIGGVRDIVQTMFGPVKYAGEYEFICGFDGLAILLKGALGASAPTGPTDVTVYTHTISTADTLPWLSIEEKVGNGFDVYRYTDAKINTLHVEVDAEGFCKGTVGLIAKTQTIGATATLPAAATQDTTPQIIGPQVGVTWDAASLPAKSFKLDINNNLDDSDFRLGSLFLGDVTEKRREIMMGVTIRPQNNNLWKEALFGSTGASAPGSVLPAAKAVVITITSYGIIAGSTTVYSCVITVPKANLKPWNLKPSGDSVLDADIEIMAIRPVAATDVITPVIKNGLLTTN